MGSPAIFSHGDSITNCSRAVTIRTGGLPSSPGGAKSCRLQGIPASPRKPAVRTDPRARISSAWAVACARSSGCSPLDRFGLAVPETRAGRVRGVDHAATIGQQIALVVAVRRELLPKTAARHRCPRRGYARPCSRKDYCRAADGLHVLFQRFRDHRGSVAFLSLRRATRYSSTGEGTDEHLDRSLPRRTSR